MLPAVIAATQVGFVALCLLGPAAFFRSRGACAPLALGGSMVLYGTVSIAAFWIAWLLLPGQTAANILRGAIMVAAVASVLYAATWGRIGSDLGWPLLILVAATVLILVWTFAGTDMTNPLRVAAERWTHALPGDNQIPFDLAEAFRSGHIPSPLHGDWLSSDRPPLQTAMYMLTPGFLLWPGNTFAYEAAAVAFQMFALLGVWALAYAMGASRFASLLAVAAVYFMPLTLVNGAYVWPKLLPAGFLCLAVAAHFGKAPRYSALMGAFTAGAAGLAMLGHGSTAFVLVGMAISAVVLHRWGSPRYVAAALIGFFALYAPWMAYQKFADPPGDRLVKWHLAGVEQVDHRPLGTVIREAYSALTPDEFIAIKKANLDVLAAGVVKNYGRTRKALMLALRGDVEGASFVLGQIRRDQFYIMALGSGLLGLSLFVLPVFLFLRQTRPVALVTITSLGLWLLLMFRPAHTVIHQGSYFLEVALVTMTVVAIASVSAVLAAIAAGLHVLLTVFQYSL